MKNFILLLLLFGLVVFGVKSCSESDWHQQQLRDGEKRRAAEQTPHVIREADGCKVYAFESGGRYHYFTRCVDSPTSTESSWEECRQSGKTKTCETKTETIGVSH